MISSSLALDVKENDATDIFGESFSNPGVSSWKITKLKLSERATRLIDGGRAAPVKYIKTEGYF